MVNQAIGVPYHPALDQDRRGQLWLYHRVRDRGQRGQIWSMLTGRSRCLLALSSVEANCKVHARRDAGLRTVSIDQICGSEGRAHDFDRDFNPLRGHTRERWLSIATARQQGKAMPPVTLIQVGDLYFVQDGHHRISVARALGQLSIEARVTVWQVEGPSPQERTAQQTVVRKRSGAVRKRSGVRREGIQLQERFLLSLHKFLNVVGTTLRAQEGGQVEGKATLGPVSV